MQTFDPNAMKPAFLKAVEATQSVIESRNVSAKLAMLPEVEAEMSPLTGRDDLKIKTSRTSVTTFNKLLNEFLFNKGTYNGIEFKSFEDFESKITTQDKEILIALLLDASYSKLPKRSATCPQCNEITEYSISVADILGNPNSVIPVWDYKEPVYDKKFTKKLYDGVLTVAVSVPTEARKNEIYNIMSYDSIRKNLVEKGQALDSTDTLLMFIDSIEISYTDKKKKKAETFKLVDIVTEIKPYLDNAPLEIHDAINEFVNEKLEKYVLDLKAPVVCKHCGNKFDISISPESEFFRKAFSI